MNKDNTASVIFKTSLDGLEVWEKGIKLDSFLEDNPDAARFRKSLSSLLYTYFRNKALIEFAVAKFARKVDPKFMRLLSIAVTEAWYHTGIPKEMAVNFAVDHARRRYGAKPAGFINAVLRKAIAIDPEKLEKEAPLVVQLNLPHVLFERWKKHFPEAEIAKFAKILREKPQFTFRLLKEIPENELKDAGCSEVRTDFDLSPFKFYKTSNPDAIFKNKWLDDGKIYVQDPVTVLSALALNPQKGEIVADLCSAPGGKTLVLAELMKGEGEIVAADSSFDRHKKTVANFARSGFKNLTVVVSSAQNSSLKGSGFDAVLLDVPCSNTGVGRHKPDALWRFSEKKLKELVQQQRKILDGASVLVKPGGRMVYSTCSIENEENSMQVRKFVSENKEFVLKEEKQILPSENNDGAYVGLLERRKTVE
ncbi:MAG TPA: hypothetical protein DCZ94_09600 [Lentisphaeria bacterium]|nr:MAG: hypothetical protein A2X48_02680 [Lentisphaerae bacterium GWF2_49_21]HBC87196.1 hypothetical protein [Lentisphaeria bacterium]